MAVFAANVTDETVELLDDVLASDKIQKFGRENKINLSDNTTLIRLALINFIRHLPSNNEIAQIKVSLMRPAEFDDFLREEK